MPVRRLRAWPALALLTSPLALGGCASTPIWPFTLLQKASPHEVEKTKDAPPVSSKAPAAHDAIQVVYLAFDVLRVEMPVDGEMNSLKVWNHVDALRVGAEAAALLGRNGFRLGAGSSGSWAAIRAILDAGNAKTSRDQLLAQSGAPLLIALGAIEGSESVFAYGEDARLSGKTFTAGSKVLQLDYAFHPELGGATDLQVGFEIRNDRGELVWERQADGSIRQVPAVDRHAFEKLKTSLTLQEGEFLVLGPSEQSANEYLVGSRFLRRGSGGERFETLLFITPQPFQTANAKPSP